MANIANIVIYDGQATPVQHTFVADSVSRQKDEITAFYKEATATVPDEAQGRITVKSLRLGSGVRRVSVRVEMPVMESVSGVNSAGYTASPKVAYVDTVEAAGYFHARSTVVGRRSVRQLAINVLGSFGASPPGVVMTGPVPEAFDLLISPT